MHMPHETNGAEKISIQEKSEQMTFQEKVEWGEKFFETIDPEGKLTGEITEEEMEDLITWFDEEVVPLEGNKEELFELAYSTAGRERSEGIVDDEESGRKLALIMYMQSNPKASSN